MIHNGFTPRFATVEALIYRGLAERGVKGRLSVTNQGLRYV